MKKIFGFVKNFFTNVAGKAIINEVEKVIEDVLNEWYDEDQEACIAAIKGSHALVPLLERIVKKTTATWDDNLAAEVRKEIEDFATSKGIVI